MTTKAFPGLIAEYRDSGRLLGVLTGVEYDGVIYLQHVMVWPGAPAGTLLRMLAEAEHEAWTRSPRCLMLDVERQHPYYDKLVALAQRRGFAYVQDTETSTWFVKYSEERRA